MNHLFDIEINKFQLNTLLNYHEKQGLKYLLQNDVSCSVCTKDSETSMKKYKLFLDRFNDIKVEGTCANCGCKIDHVMPFGHSETFFRKAIQFRYKYAMAAES